VGADRRITAAAVPTGTARETLMRDVVTAIFYIAQSGCHWRMLPKEFPPFTSVQYYSYRWRDDGT